MKIAIIFLVSSFFLRNDCLELFIADVNANPNLATEFTNNPNLIGDWNDFASMSFYSGSKKGHDVRNNVAFLKKYNQLDQAKKSKLKGYMEAQKSFINKKGGVDYQATREIDIGDGVVREYTISYDKYGFPEFETHCPPGFNPDISDLRNHFTTGKSNLDGGRNDFTAANNWLKQKFPDKDITKTNTGFVLNESGQSIEYTWHHHQNGIDIFPVPRAVHNTGTVVDGVPYQGFPHSGGKSLIDEAPVIRGFFPDPNF